VKKLDEIYCQRVKLQLSMTVDDRQQVTW